MAALSAFAFAITLAGCGVPTARLAAPPPDLRPPATAPPGPPADDWTTFAHDQSRTGYQPQRIAITTQNVRRLRLRWRFQSGDGLQASPLVAGGRVYVASLHGDVRALDVRTGAVVWRVATGELVAMTPALADGLLFVGDHRSGGDLIALDVRDGRILWRTPFAGGVRSEPAIAKSVVYIGETGGDPPPCHQGGVRALRERTGALLWRWNVDDHEHEGGSVWSPVSVEGDRLFFGTGNACESGIDAADAIVSLDASGKRQWAVSTADSIVDSDVGGGTLLVHDEAIAESKNGTLYDLDRDSGRIIWATPLGGAPGYGGFGSPSTDGTTIVASAGFATDPTRAHGPPGGSLVGLDRRGRIVWRVHANEPVSGSVAIASGVAYTPLDAKFVALDLRTGAQLWSYPAGQASYSSPAVVPSGVYFANEAGEVFAFSLPENRR